MNSILPSTELESVSQLWNELLPFDLPDKFTINLMLRQHGLETVMYGVEETAVKRSKLGGQMERPYALRLFGAVCCSVTRAKKQHRSEPRN
jgi:hypothetical protein